jgi:ketosteroid isomerase-like protein
METWMVVGVIVVSVVALCLFLAYKQMQRAEMQEPGREAPPEKLPAPIGQQGGTQIMQDAQQDPRTAATIELIRRLDETFVRRDVGAIMALTTEDVVWETTAPPDGQRYQGQAAVRSALEEFYRSSPQAVFTMEEVVVLGERAFFTWVYRWTGQDGKQGHVRGVELVRVRDGKIAEMLSYVKG